MSTISRLSQGAAAGIAERMTLVEKQSNRGAYEYLTGLQRQGVIRNNALITEGFLRSEVPVAQQNQISFPITKEQGTPANNTERRLNVSDAFCVTHIGVFLKPTGSTPALNAQSRLVTYDAPSVNGGTNDIYTIYNGYLSIRVNQTVYFDRYDCLRFYRAGTAQSGLTTTDIEWSANTWDSVNSGMSPIVPFINFGGTDDNIVDLVLPANIDLTNNNATAVFVCRGLLIQNA